ncbi:hypothetical protein B645_12490, partial [Enterococcus hirae 88-15-E09]
IFFSLIEEINQSFYYLSSEKIFHLHVTIYVKVHTWQNNLQPFRQEKDLNTSNKEVETKVVSIKK